MDFERASSFDDLLRANVSYLRGHLGSAPYHHGPPAPESALLLPQLVCLHTQRRLFTFESQPGLCEVRWIKQLCRLQEIGSSCSSASSGSDSSSGDNDRSVWSSSAGGCGCGDECEETQQRAYVDFWAEAEALDPLLEHLDRHAEHLWYFVNLPGRPDHFQCNIPTDATWRDASGRPHLNLTRTRAGPSYAALDSAPWEQHTDAPLFPGWADAEVATLARANPRLAPVLRRCVLVIIIIITFNVHGSQQDS